MQKSITSTKIVSPQSTNRKKMAPGGNDWPAAAYFWRWSQGGLAHSGGRECRAGRVGRGREHAGWALPRALGGALGAARRAGAAWWRSGWQAQGGLAPTGSSETERVRNGSEARYKGLPRRDAWRGSPAP